MSLKLYVDGPRWHAHMKQMHDRHPGIVPVAKGNGYGFGVDRLATKATSLGVDTMAVGTYDEVPTAAALFDGTVLVLTPWRPFETAAVFDERVVHTVGRLADLRDLASRSDAPRVLLERMTSMRRHGFSARELRAAARGLSGSGIVVEGVAMHLPLAHGSHLPEMHRLMTDVVAAGLDTRRVYVSHLSDDELGALSASYPEYEFRPRIGTALWLGAPAALRVRADVLDVHPVQRGDVFGYRSRTAPRNGTILVVSGGTSHGIGLEAPTSGATFRDRVARVAQGGLDAAGLVRSPFTIGGKHRLFAEPPHMQVSMLFLPSGAEVPEIGDEVAVRMRLTTATFDRTLVS